MNYPNETPANYDGGNAMATGASLIELAARRTRCAGWIVGATVQTGGLWGYEDSWSNSFSRWRPHAMAMCFTPLLAPSFVDLLGGR